MSFDKANVEHYERKNIAPLIVKFVLLIILT